MKVLGVAPLIAAPTFLYLTLAIVITFSSGSIFKITEQNYTPVAIIGAVLVVIGAIMVISCGRKLLKTFNKGILMTDGLYRIFRNPMYAAYLIFILPGIALLFNSWLALFAVIVNFILFTIFIKREHRYLEEKFGSEYDKYLEKVLIKFL